MNIRTVAVLGLMFGALSCAPSTPRPFELRTYTESYALLVSWTPMPPTARTPITFRVVVRDKTTKAPIERGEGRIFASSADGVNVYDSFIAAPESGTYTGKMSFVTAGDWAVGIQFRKDSLSKLERPDGDFRMTIHNEVEGKQ